MPQLTVKIPVGPQTFAARARRKAGLGSFFANVPTPPLPAGGTFGRGLSAYFSKPGGPLPPNPVFGPLAHGMSAYFSKPGGPLPPNPVFGPLARGMRSFFMRPAQQPPLPAPSVFGPYANPNKCATCRKRCFRRKGMGQDNLDPSMFFGAGYDPAQASLLPGFSSVPLDDQAFADSIWNNNIAAGGPAPTYSVPSDLGTTLAPQGGAVVSGASSNPALDAYNQALTNAQAANSALSNPSTLAKLSTAAGAATPAQLTAAASQLTPASTTAAAATPGIAAQITNWLAESTVISGVSNSTVAFGGAAALVLVSLLASKKKGKR